MKERFPQLVVDLKKLNENCQQVVAACSQIGVSVTAVIKGCNGLMPIVDAMAATGIHSFGSSRLSHLTAIAKRHPDMERWLLRIPMLSEIDEVVTWATVSLQSEVHTLAAANRTAEETGVVHRVVLMLDLGDLREGVWGTESLVAMARFVEHECNNLHLLGIGTNLGCYGAIRPNRENMNQLASAAEAVNQAIGRPLEIVSGGATSTYPMVLSNTLPQGVNHLRIGEGILLSKDLKVYFGMAKALETMATDTFVLRAQVVEIQRKPSHPVGEIFVDAFGNRPEYTDIGMRIRAIVAVGKQDFGDHTKLIATVPGMEIVGSSSDHLIVDITDCEGVASFAVGDVFTFELYYPAMLYLSIDRDVVKVYHA